MSPSIDTLVPNLSSAAPSSRGQLRNLRPAGGEVAGRVAREHVRGPLAVVPAPRSPSCRRRSTRCSRTRHPQRRRPAVSLARCRYSTPPSFVVCVSLRKPLTGTRSESGAAAAAKIVPGATTNARSARTTSDARVQCKWSRHEDDRPLQDPDPAPGPSRRRRPRPSRAAGGDAAERCPYSDGPAQRRTRTNRGVVGFSRRQSRRDRHGFHFASLRGDVSVRQAKCRLRPAYRARDGEPERVSRERRA